MSNLVRPPNLEIVLLGKTTHPKSVYSSAFSGAIVPENVYEE